MASESPIGGEGRNAGQSDGSGGGSGRLSALRQLASPDPDERLGTKATLVGLLFFFGGGLAVTAGLLVLFFVLVTGVIVGFIHAFIWVLTLGWLSLFDSFITGVVVPYFTTVAAPLLGLGGVLWSIGYGIVRARWWGWYAGLAATAFGIAALLYPDPTLSTDLVGPFVLAALVAWSLWDERAAYGIGNPTD